MIGSVLCAALAATPITLDEARAAGRQNLDALKAELDALKAGEGKRLSLSPILPQLSLQTGIAYTARGPSRVVNPLPEPADGSPYERYLASPGTGQGSFTLGLTLTQLLYDGGRWWSEIARAGAADEAARGQLAEQRLASEFEAARRFFELLRAQASRDVLAASVERSQVQLERARGLYQAGRAQKRDALDAEINLGQDQVSVLRQEDAINGGQSSLLKWISRPAEKVRAVDPGAVKGEAEPPFELLLARAKKQRPLLASLDARVRVAERAVDVAWAGHLPRVSGNLAYQRSAPSADPFFTDPTRQNALNLGVSLSWDLFSGFSTTAQVASARQDLKVAHLQLEQAARELEVDLAQAAESLARTREILEIVRRNQALANESLTMAEERYAAGASTSLEVRDAQVKLTQVELQLLQGRIDVEVARASLWRLAGGTEESP